MTEREIVQETVDFYSQDLGRRSKNQVGYCVYNGLNGTHCAIGRCLLPHYTNQGEALKVGPSVAANNLAKALKVLTFDELLQEKYRGHQRGFWTDLQRLHDDDSFWNESGLTQNGELYARRLYDTNY